VPQLGLQLGAPRVPELEQPAGVAHEAATRLLHEVIFQWNAVPGGSRQDLLGIGRRGCGSGAGAVGLEEEVSACEQWVLR
jgi:hypothetical protein